MFERAVVTGKVIVLLGAALALPLTRRHLSFFYIFLKMSIAAALKGNKKCE